MAIFSGIGGGGGGTTLKNTTSSSAMGIYSPTLTGVPDWYYEQEAYRQASIMQMRAHALSLSERLEARLLMPMAETNNKGVRHVHIAAEGPKVFLFCIVRDEPIILTDDANMYPSDTLITQLRTLMD